MMGRLLHLFAASHADPAVLRTDAAHLRLDAAWHQQHADRLRGEAEQAERIAAAIEGRGEPRGAA